MADHDFIRTLRVPKSPEFTRRPSSLYTKKVYGLEFRSVAVTGAISPIES